MRKPEDEKRSGGSMSDKEGMRMGSDPPAVGSDEVQREFQYSAKT